LNEALSLRWSDIHADRGCFDYRLKGGRIDTYPIDANIVRVLREYRVHYDRWQKMAKRKGLRSPEVCAKLGYVFPARTGGKWWHAYDAMKAAGKSVGVVVHAHKIRHSVAQWYVEGGGPVEGLQIIMGHKNIATTQGYYQRHLKIKKRARKSINFNL
jgi:integrase